MSEPSPSRTELLELLAAKDLRHKHLDAQWTEALEEARKYKAELREARHLLRAFNETQEVCAKLMRQAAKAKVEFALFFDRMAKPCGPPPAGGDCTTCAEPLVSNPCCMLPCSHIFHLDCARKWCQEGDNGRECPLCRKHLAACAGVKRPLAAEE